MRQLQHHDPWQPQKGVLNPGMQRSERLRFTLLAVAALVPPIAVSIAAASYGAANFAIGGTAVKAIKVMCFFTVLLAEALVYIKFQQGRRWRPGRDQPPPPQPAP